MKIPRLASDSIYAIVINIIPRITNVVFFIVIGRVYGTSLAGSFALAATYLIILTTLIRGIDEFVTREVSRAPEQRGAYFLVYASLNLVIAVFLYGGLYFFVRFILNYSDELITTTSILCVSIIPDSLNYLAQGILLGQRKFALPALVTFIVACFRIVVGLQMALQAHAIATLAWIWLGGSILGALITSAFVLQDIFTKIRPTQVFKKMAISREAFSFLLITILLTIEGQADIILLGSVRSTTDVSWYNAATTVAFSLSMIALAYRTSLYPLMAQYAVHASDKLEKLHEKSIRYMAILVFPMVAGILILANKIVLLIYGIEFMPTAAALQILVPVLIAVFLNVPYVRLMLVMDRQKWNLAFLIISTSINIGLNLFLDPEWGIYGASTARLCSTSIYFLLVYLYVQRNYFALPTWRIVARPLLSALIMAGAVWAVRELPLAVSISTGVIVYSSLLLISGEIRPNEIPFLRQITNKFSLK
jgi:O-antigen/teichoic acid export membrane protein